jgi:hypothetical protein
MATGSDSREHMLALAEQNGFSRQDASALLNFTKIMTSKVLKEFLIKFITEFDNSQVSNDQTNKQTKVRQALQKKILGKLQRLPSEKFTGYQELGMVDVHGTEYKIRIQIGMVSRDNEITLRIPDVSQRNTMIRGIFSCIDKFVDMTKQSYVQMTAQSQLHTDIAGYLSHLDISELKVNVNNRTMYLDENFPMRVGILCYYVDEKGDPIHYLTEDTDAPAPAPAATPAAAPTSAN